MRVGRLQCSAVAGESVPTGSVGWAKSRRKRNCRRRDAGSYLHAVLNDACSDDLPTSRRRAAPVWAAADDALRESIADALQRAREQTLSLLAMVDPATLGAAPAAPLRPLLWHLQHLADFEERWVLGPLGATRLTSTGLDVLQDELAEDPDALAELLDFPTVRAWMAQTRARMLALLARTDFDPSDPLRHTGYVFGLALQHEHRTFEQVLEVLQHGTSRSFLPPKARATARTRRPIPEEVYLPGGEFVLGSDDDPWSLDVERPAHVVRVAPFHLDATPVSNGGFAAFVEEGGYARRELWSEEGWAFRQANAVLAPLYWERAPGGRWQRRRFGVVEPLPFDEPAQHLSFFEAEAYARFVGKRLPTEAEWAFAAAFDPADGARRYPWGEDAPTNRHANLGCTRWSPSVIGTHPQGRSASGCEHLLGDVWEWTTSSALPYPGFVPFPVGGCAAARFDPAQKVLRGGSWATHPAALRISARRFASPGHRHLFAGFRCAR